MVIRLFDLINKQYVSGRWRPVTAFYCTFCEKVIIKRSDSPESKYCRECKITEHPIYNILDGMKQRCYNSNNPNYKNYGNRGIKVCEEWINYPDKFIKWAIKNNYELGLSIDRINNDGNYEPKNCRWLTVSENIKRSLPNRKPQSKITIEVYNTIMSLRDKGLSSSKIAMVVNLSPRYIRQLCTKQFIPKTIKPLVGRDGEI